MQTISHYLHPIINHFAVVVNELHVLHSIHRLSKDYLHILCGCQAVYGMMRVRYDPNCARNRLPTVSHRLHIVVDRFYVVIDDLCSAFDKQHIFVHALHALVGLCHVVIDDVGDFQKLRNRHYNLFLCQFIQLLPPDRSALSPS